MKTVIETVKNESINKEENIEKSKIPIWKKIFITLLVMFILGIMSIIILFYGPIPTFREWWITTAMTTMTHQYLAEWFFDEVTINAVLANNTIEETEEETDTTLITVVTKPQEEEKEQEEQYSNEYEKQILAKKLDKDYVHWY